MEIESANSQVDWNKVENLDLIRKIIALIGDDPNRAGVIDTPKRVLKSYNELFSGYSEKAEDALSTVFEGEGYDQMVILKDIEMYSTCEHHMIPFVGKVHIGYIPSGKVVGLSKLARLVEVFSRRLQIQERLTEQIAKSIDEILQPNGVMVVVEAKHFCMCARGVHKQHSSMVTSSVYGALAEPEARAEFMSLIK